MTNDQLYMTVGEQHEALASAGFRKVERLLLRGGLVLHRASSLEPDARVEPGTGLER